MKKIFFSLTLIAGGYMYAAQQEGKQSADSAANQHPESTCQLRSPRNGDLKTNTQPSKPPIQVALNVGGSDQETKQAAHDQETQAPDRISQAESKRDAAASQVGNEQRAPESPRNQKLRAVLELLKLCETDRPLNTQGKELAREAMGIVSNLKNVGSDFGGNITFGLNGSLAGHPKQFNLFADCSTDLTHVQVPLAQPQQAPAANAEPIRGEQGGLRDGVARLAQIFAQAGGQAAGLDQVISMLAQQQRG